jgi:hypothetical protein
VRPSFVDSHYLSALTSDNPIYCAERHCQSPHHYFGVLQLNISMNGSYSLVSNSIMNMFGYLYDGIFDPAILTRNLLTFNNESTDNNHFRLEAFLENGKTYDLVVTTSTPNVTGLFAIMATGPEAVTYTRLNKSSKHMNHFIFQCNTI